MPESPPVLPSEQPESKPAKKRRGPKKKSTTKAIRRPASAGKEPVDLFDRVDARLAQLARSARSNTLNVAVASGIVALIVVAHWATQQEIQPPLEARSAPVTETTAMETASAQETGPQATTPAEESTSPTPAPAEATEAPAEEPPAVATTAVPPPAETTPLPELSAPAVAPTGMVIETSISIRAPLEPAKPPPAIEPAASVPKALHPSPPRRVAVGRARHKATAQIEALVRDPYTDGGPLDLDSPTVRQHYLLQNKSLKTLTATRTE